MKKQKIWKHFIITSLFILPLAACAQKEESKTTSTSSETYTLQSSSQAAHEDVRLNFNSIHIAHAVDNFQGGTTLEELESLYGKPNAQEQVPAGDVTLDSYTWNFDNVSVSAQLFDNSTIARSISNFEFTRHQTIAAQKYEKLQKDTTSYEQTVQILGEPDVLSQSASSENEIIQAVWTSGIKSVADNPNINLTFTNNILTSQSQVGLE